MKTTRQKAKGAGREGAASLDRHALYELCAQNPGRDARLLRAIWADGVTATPGNHRRDACATTLVLGEDFCGTAALSRAWCGLGEGFRAIGVDHDAATLARAPVHPRVRLIERDVIRVREKVDVVAVQNFSICELRTRRALLAYLKHARSRLRRGGCFVCDIYGGSDAFLTGTVEQAIRPPKGSARGIKITYEWEQRTADALAGRVMNAMHFVVREPGRKPVRMDNAFTYEWRLWSVPELRDAMREAGFAGALVYPRTAAAEDSDGVQYAAPIEDAVEVGDSFNVYVVGR